MEHFIGLDVSVKETSVCVVDGADVLVLEAKVPSEPVAIAEVMAQPTFCIKTHRARGGAIVAVAL